MKYQTIPSQLFTHNRTQFSQKLSPNSLAIFNANDIFITGADSSLPFVQNKDLFYLCGIDQEETVLIIYPNAPNPNFREILFIKETNDFIAVWEGEKVNQKQATEISGIKTVFWLSELDRILTKLLLTTQIVYINQNQHKRAPKTIETRDDRFAKNLQQQYPKISYQSSYLILNELRGLKHEIEIAQIKKACDITKIGFDAVLHTTQPGVFEYEIEATLSYHFLKNASSGFAYTPIVASGKNACILHYIQNNQQCRSGDLILIDAAANYANYSSDLTRTIPVNGKFSYRQKEIYQAVLRVKNKATNLLTDGLLWEDYNKAVGEWMTEALLDLKLLSRLDLQQQTLELPAYKKYYMHGTSHHLGLDTHDYGTTEGKIMSNMVLTVEPGIYIPAEGIGIRLEDNVVIQKNTPPINLMQHIPITVEEIEEMMHKK